MRSDWASEAWAGATFFSLRSVQVLAGPTPAPTPNDVSVSVDGGLFYLLLFLGTVLFLAAFFYGRRGRG